MDTQKKTLISWAFYDWANSAFSVIVQTFVFATYFVSSVAVNPIEGTVQWGFMNAIAAILTAIGAPIFGAIADKSGYKKELLAITTLICITMTAALWFIKPVSSYATIALVVVCIGIIASETSYVFYNALLPEFASSDKLGKWSGWGWGMGYAGGTVCLLISLLFIFNLQHENSSDDVRRTFLFTACWYALFSLPIFLLTPPSIKIGLPLGEAIYSGLNSLRTNLKNLKGYRTIVRFLIARMLYLDGITTLFIFGGTYAAATFNMNERDILAFGIALNVSAGIGAFLFARLDDKIGSKKMILISLAGLTIPTFAILFVYKAYLFWILGLALAFFVGPIQASSRAFLARLSPAHLRNEMFGYFALSGKATAFLGPTLVSTMIMLTGSQRLGLSVIIVFYVLGGILLSFVPNQIDLQK